MADSNSHQPASQISNTINRNGKKCRKIFYKTPFSEIKISISDWDVDYSSSIASIVANNLSLLTLVYFIAPCFL